MFPTDHSGCCSGMAPRGGGNGESQGSNQEATAGIRHRLVVTSTRRLWRTVEQQYKAGLTGLAGI